ncbi:UNVERIFIED_CONTAM: Protein-lysine methyltransferase C42C1.13 [Sesamum calycinum]|uniref:Protein-lysine methyltransferase C42C1.13 n=1 Tax=Sesamum calycinum TaxID=2727403 RepID=A0AAW2RBG5_9LAMI
MAEGAATDEEVENVVAGLGSYGGKVGLVSDCEEEIMLLWAIQQPIFSKHNAFVSQSALQLHIDACGRSLSILQSPSSLGTPGVTGSVMWDSGIILGKFLEHSVESGTIFLQGKNVIELGSGCGLVGGIKLMRWYGVAKKMVKQGYLFLRMGSSALTPYMTALSNLAQLHCCLLGAQVILTDLPDRLKLLKKNVETNLYGDVRGSATVNELTWGDDLDTDITDPSPDFVLGSDVVYSEGAVLDLMETLVGLCGKQTTVILAGELRNDAILEYFLEAAMKEFVVGRVDQDQWHPDYCSSRVAIYVLVKK